MKVILDHTTGHLREHAERIATLLGLTRDLPISYRAFGGSYFNPIMHVVILDPIEMTWSGGEVFCLAHEMRHALQREQNQLKDYVLDGWIGMARAVWKDQPYCAAVRTQEEYEQLPWEADANKFAREYCEVFEESKSAAA